MTMTYIELTPYFQYIEYYTNSVYSFYYYATFHKS